MTKRVGIQIEATGAVRRTGLSRVAMVGMAAVLLALALAGATQAAPILTAQIGDGLAGSLNTLAGPVYEIMGSGTDVWGTADDCYFVYQEFAAGAPFDMWARVGLTGFVGGTDGWRKAGIMVRQALTDTSRGAEMVIAEADANGVNTQIRKADSAGALGSTEGTGTRINYDTPAYLRLEYLGDGVSFNTYYKKNLADPWLRQDTPAFNKLTTAMTGTFVAGLFVTAHNVGQQTTVQFGDVNGFVLLEPAAGTLQWDPVAGSNNWSTSNWLAVAPGPPPPPPNYPDGTIIAVLDSANTVTVDGNHTAYGLNISNSGVVSIGANNSLLVRGPINASPGGTISLGSNATLTTGPDSDGGTVQTLITNASGGLATVDIARAQLLARQLTMAGGDKLVKAGYGRLLVDQSAGANVLDGTNTVQVNLGELRMQGLATSPLNGADLVLNGGTFTVMGAVGTTNVLRASRWTHDGDINTLNMQGTYADAISQTFTGSSVLLSQTPTQRAVQAGALNYNETTMSTFFGLAAAADQYQAWWTGYYNAKVSGDHTFGI